MGAIHWWCVGGAGFHPANFKGPDFVLSIDGLCIHVVGGANSSASFPCQAAPSKRLFGL